MLGVVRILIVLLILASLSITTARDPEQMVLKEGGDTFKSVRDALKTAEIIDDVIDDFEPKCLISPYYGQKKQREVALGNTLKPSHTKEIPQMTILCTNVSFTEGLTIILTDPDAPSRDNPKWSEMCHWIAIFPPAPDSDLKPVVQYKPPGPPEKTGYHRYVFLLLEGDNSNLTVPEDRQHWGTGKEGHGVRDWAQKEGLKVIGANFFYGRNKKQ
ncbi:hypothetical protein B7494_g7811 [Chlorociboria aeruginascens]|nr:hypothetical protein B7494_g7811 [Chlorociboria aeruginascens]